MRSRTKMTVGTRLECNLLAYATAASAAGVSALVLTQVSEARVVYTPTHRVIKTNEHLFLDVNNDGLDDFKIINLYSCSDTCVVALSALPAQNGNFVAGYKGRHSSLLLAYAFVSGARIGTNRQFFGRLMASVGTFLGYIGQWLNVKNRYLGLQFQIKGKSHYGWARMTVKATTEITATLTGYAYETKPDKRIIAGDVGPPKKAADSIRATEKGTLGNLALGGAGRQRVGRTRH